MFGSILIMLFHTRQIFLYASHGVLSVEGERVYRLCYPVTRGTSVSVELHKYRSSIFPPHHCSQATKTQCKIVLKNDQ